MNHFLSDGELTSLTAKHQFSLFIIPRKS